MEEKKNTLVDNFIITLKNNKWFSIIIIIGIVIIALGQISGSLKSIKEMFFENGNKTTNTKTLQEENIKTPDSSINKSMLSTSPNHTSNKEPPLSNISKKVNKNPIYYKVSLILPSRMNGADIFVDKKPAKILKDTPTIKVIQVEKKSNNHLIEASMDGKICKKQQFIRENNIKICLCQ